MDAIILERFKSFRNREKIELSPITFLVGRNSVGKTTILKTVSLLADFLRSDDQRKLTFTGANSGKHKVSNYENALHWGCDGNEGFVIGISKSGYQFDFGFNEVKGVGAIISEFTIHDSESNDLMLKLSSDTKLFTLEIDNAFIRLKGVESKSYLELLDEKKTYDRLQIEQKAVLEHVRAQLKEVKTSSKEFRELTSRRTSLERVVKDLGKLLKENAKKIEGTHLGQKSSFSEQFIELLPHMGVDLTIMAFINAILEKNKYQSISDVFEGRWHFDSTHIPSNRLSASRINVNSDDTADINRKILDLPEAHFRVGDAADQFLKKWMDHEHFGIGRDYRLKNIEGTASYIEVQSFEGASQEWVNLVDKGFGLAQVFNILLYIAYEIEFLYYEDNLPNPNNDNIIVIEEPESNLHPAFQSILADLFYEVYRKYRIRFVIETHSEYLIRRTQVLVNQEHLEGKLGNNPFKVYYIDKDRGMYPMPYREDGIFTEEFGPGFLDVSRKLARKLL